MENYQNLTLPQLVEATEAFFKSQKYKSDTLANYQRTWKKLLKYAEIHGVEHYSLEFGLEFVRNQYGLDMDFMTPPYTQRYTNFVFRAVRCLSEYQLHGMFFRRVKMEVYVWPQQFEKSFCEYLQWRKTCVSAKTLYQYDYILRRFADYLSQNGLRSLDEITASHIHGFLGTLQRYVPATVDIWLSRIRAFLEFSYSRGYSATALAAFVPKASYVPTTSIPTTYTKEEIDRLLSTVDRANPVGKRDYAMLLLAVRLGIRSGDIRNLRYENLRWDANQITIIQEKTGHNLVLPLLNDVGDSIIDYLKNGRPETASEFIFVKHCAPFEQFASSSALYQMMKKYLQMAKLSAETPKKAGLHSLRHSLASVLLEQETPLPIITEILGHLNTNTTKIYTRIDITQLKKCALDAPVFPDRGERL